jgi:hypothetical protein
VFRYGLLMGARIHDQLEILGFVGKYDESPTKIRHQTLIPKAEQNPEPTS